jgi:hypothetical protein
VYICPSCNREIETPEYPERTLTDHLFGRTFWRSGDDGNDGTGDTWMLSPVCPCGRRLRNWIVGEFQELPPLVASLWGLLLGGIGVLIAALADQARRKQGADHLLVLPVAIAIFVLYGIAALWTGLTWSSQQGPVTRLAPRAYGVAIGFLTPALLLALAALTGTATDLSLLDPIVDLLPRK